MNVKRTNRLVEFKNYLKLFTTRLINNKNYKDFKPYIFSYDNCFFKSKFRLETTLRRYYSK
jgi:hypothetical protein